MKKTYTDREILDMAVGLLAADPDADLDGDGDVTAADARAAARRAAGLEDAPPPPADAPGRPAREDLISRILRTDPGKASSGFDADALFRDYVPIYENAASKAAENAYGLLASRTGGYGSSYAVTASAGVYDDYMKELADRRTELMRLQTESEKLALSKQQATLSALYDALGLLDGDEARAYGRAQDELSLAFRAAALGDFSRLAALGFDVSSVEEKQALALASEKAQLGDYSALEALGIDVSALREKDELSRAERAAKYGDYSLLEALGIDVEQKRYEDLLSVASALAKLGDYSALEALGVDLTSLREKDALETALALAKYGDFSLLGGFTDNASALRARIPASVQKGAENAYAYGGRSALTAYLDRQVGYGQITEEDKRRILVLLTGA